MNTYLSDDEKRSLLEGNLRSFALDSYGHELNRQVAVDAGDTEAVAVAEAAIATIDAASATYEVELQALTPDSGTVTAISNE